MAFWDKMRPFLWNAFLVISSLPFALAPIIVLATAAEEASVGYILGRNCYPNGLWKEASGATWRIMDSSYFFTPNLSFGAMTFTQVKVIDIAWDLCVGRGGQLLLAWVNYRVLNEWLLYHMEMHLTSYKMYTAVAFETTTLSTLGVLGKEFLAFGQKSWKRFFRWLAVLCMLLATLYVLAFPTLMAAMTGYITTYKPYVEDYEHNLIEWEKVSPIQYIIEDSHRVGNYSKPLLATDDDPDLTNAVRNYTDHYMYEILFLRDPDGPSNPEPRSFTFSGSGLTVFVFDGTVTELDSPTLNITYFTNGSETGSISPGLTRYFYSLSSDRQGDRYNASYIHTHGSCKPSETYQWGFSYIFLFMVSIFNFIWSCIMVGMWLDVCRGSRMYKSGRRPGLLRSVMDISTVIKEELGEEAERMEEKELRRRLRESDGALLVPKKELRVTRTDASGAGVKKRGWRRRLTRGSTF
ncbi:hypothetical protein BU26DRAFT_562948 [Trematosphaeria pertusa]|uniref:Uncharacterized protein n=1 Tax=Trematosphaeria pertusa TaxID=390896 RepID=A0A6A6ILA6_9PLEO|nr:uncharacterized protein BU26DRAFT_562948 [Trematosphaeria pertusa]KAF2250987.1 hypothetical protein BU26DRAFT_562948 [Trematosphaeria pertusa]